MGSSRGPRCSGLTGAEQGSRGGGELRSCGGDGDGDGAGASSGRAAASWARAAAVVAI